MTCTAATSSASCEQEEHGDADQREHEEQRGVHRVAREDHTERAGERGAADEEDHDSHGQEPSVISDCPWLRAPARRARRTRARPTS